MKREDVDLRDLLEEDRRDVEEIEQSQQELIDEAESNYGSFEEVPDSVVETLEDLEDKRAERQQMLDTAESKIEEIEEEWGGTEFTISELSTGNAARIQDKTGVEVQDGVDRFSTGEGAALVELLRLCVDESPPDAPNKVDDHPLVASQLLARAIAELSGLPSEEDLGKSSARDLMSFDN